MATGVLSTERPGEDPPDRFIYDPEYPVQTVGGNNCCSPHIVPWGPYDQRSVEMRDDVLCFTAPPFEQDTEVTGPITLTLYAETDGPDTDWTAKLVDVSTTGYAMNLCDGIVRARYRESRTDPTLLTPNSVYEYEIEVGVTGNVFRKGHSLRLEVSSSNFPRFDRNPNTGNEYGRDAETRVGAPGGPSQPPVPVSPGAAGHPGVLAVRLRAPLPRSGRARQGCRPGWPSTGPRPPG